MRCLVVESNIVTNIAEASAAYAQSQGWEPAPDGVEIGWTRTAIDQPWQPPALQVMPVPDQVLRWQAVRALRLHADPNAPERSCLDTVNALRDAITDELMRADLDDALQHVMTWRRASPTLAMMATAAGWSAEFVDQLFIDAEGYDL